MDYSPAWHCFRAAATAVVLMATYGCVPLPFVAIHSVAAGGGHSCRLTSTGGVECWGSDDVGQIGNGTPNWTAVLATPVPGVSSASAVAAGAESHTCAVVVGGAIKCWGMNTSGQLGNGSTNNSASPVDTGLTGATDVATGEAHSCAIISGAVWCWGDNSFGEFGNGTTTNSLTPVASGVTGAGVISAGIGYTCGVFGGGVVKCWGTGPLGTGTSVSLTPVQVPGISASSVAAGQTSACALATNGTVFCWGTNNNGELGNGDPNLSPSKTPVPVVGITGGTAVAVGGAHACAVVKSGAVSGSVQCWGDNSDGQLGNTILGSGANCSSANVATCTVVPITVPGITTAVSVAAGDSHTCALLSDGRTTCWGWNGFGQLGNGIFSNGDQFPTSPVPVWVTRKAISAGGDTLGGHSCALLPDGSTKCWGSNVDGELGNGTSTPLGSAVPVTVSGLAQPLTISVGGSHSCASVSSGLALFCWGDNTFGQIGPAGQVGQPNSIPVQVPGLFNITAVAAGRQATCAITSGLVGVQRTLFCFGNNMNGQLGVSPSDPRMQQCQFGEPCSPTPLTVPGLIPLEVSGGDSHFCAIRDDSSIACWGFNQFGQLGNGSNADSFVPVLVNLAPFPQAVEVSAGSMHNCALLTDGSVWCWGRNRLGQLGNNTMQDSNVPVHVPLPLRASAVAAGSDTSCALMVDGSIQCWGDNGVGELGAGSNAPSSLIPVAVKGITTATALSTGNDAGQICAILADGSGQCWGSNVVGELGNGTSGNFSNVPTTITNF
jgi:alpha-tubulin suppressor-like RCC1 family protein